MYAYDIETFPNVFTCVIKNIETQEDRSFEISQRKNDVGMLIKTFQWLSTSGKVMVGFNNLGFDYPVVKYLIEKVNLNQDGEKIANDIYQYAKKIIEGERVYVKGDNQLDLYKVHHFDNKAKTVGLKMLEFNMRSQNIEDLPFKPGTVLSHDDIDVLIEYNKHDVDETIKFFKLSQSQIKFRQELSEKYNENMLSYNDMKIGTRYFIRELEKEGVRCYNDDGSPRQTKRSSIDLGEVIFPYVEFSTPEFNSLKNWISNQVISETKGVFNNIPEESLGELSEYSTLNKGIAKNLNVMFKGFRFDLGTGGLHGSIKNSHVKSDDEYVIKDIDVKSYYPSIVVHNKLYPEHLGSKFPEIYAQIKKMRFQYKKGTAENKMLKLALNAAGFGDTNNVYSPFYDPKMTMTVTINGQLMLCMLAESLMTKIDSLEIIQANTDGLTVKLRRDSLALFQSLTKDWENRTGMELEEVEYSDMWIRDVNNYVAKSINGDVKRIGAAFKFDLDWHQNHSSLVIQKAISAYLIDGVDIEEFILNHKDPFDFMLRYKVNKGSKLILETKVNDEVKREELQSTTRYFIAKNGGNLVKVMPPLAHGKEERLSGINVGYKVVECNNSKNFSFENLNYDWYINQAKEIIEPIFKVEQKHLFDFE